MKKAILHKGFALVDIFQPCVSFNKTNTFKWFKDNTSYLPDDYDPSDRVGAFKKSLEEEPFPLGIIYQSDHRATFEENLEVYKRDRIPPLQKGSRHEKGRSRDKGHDLKFHAIVSAGHNPR